MVYLHGEHAITLDSLSKVNIKAQRYLAKIKEISTYLRFVGFVGYKRNLSLARVLEIHDI